MERLFNATHTEMQEGTSSSCFYPSAIKYCKGRSSEAAVKAKRECSSNCTLACVARHLVLVLQSDQPHLSPRTSFIQGPFQLESTSSSASLVIATS
jgi:hypothetical protein